MLFGGWGGCWRGGNISGSASADQSAVWHTSVAEIGSLINGVSMCSGETVCNEVLVEAFAWPYLWSTGKDHTDSQPVEFVCFCPVFHFRSYLFRYLLVLFCIFLPCCSFFILAVLVFGWKSLKRSHSSVFMKGIVHPENVVLLFREIQYMNIKISKWSQYSDGLTLTLKMADPAAVGGLKWKTSSHSRKVGENTPAWVHPSCVCVLSAGWRGWVGAGLLRMDVMSIRRWLIGAPWLERGFGSLLCIPGNTLKTHSACVDLTCDQT